ncbi:hypothetical protein ACTQ49_08245 [Luteococcus sp. Sow4_B9]|uniref:hypothetical protein n=1 Tax=Luteococcus sp. Sow4_B9 TaxID=3438792 RepID=UPI003F9E2562
MTRELKMNDCKGTCDWQPTDELSDGQRIFACTPCGSEWTSDQGWTPRNADGEVPAAVAAEKAAATPRTAMGEQEPPAGHGGNSVGAW